MSPLRRALADNLARLREEGGLDLPDLEADVPLTMALVRELAGALGVEEGALLAMPAGEAKVSALAAGLELAPEARAWVASIADHTLRTLGEPPSGDSLLRVIEARRTLAAHPLEDKQVRVVVLRFEGGPVLALDDVVVVADQGEQELNLRLAFMMVRWEPVAP